jgi:hypothetical protein
VTRGGAAAGEPLPGALAFESLSSAAAAANERISATLAKIAKPSRSGSFDMSNPETIDFDNFYFQFEPLSIGLG